MENCIFRKAAITRFDFASERAAYYFGKLKNCEQTGNPINSKWATKFAQAIRIENYYKKEFSKALKGKI